MEFTLMEKEPCYAICDYRIHTGGNNEIKLRKFVS